VDDEDNDDLHQQVNITTSNGNFEQRRRHCVRLSVVPEGDEIEEVVGALGIERHTL
jgi:hypothetical protein